MGADRIEHAGEGSRTTALVDVLSAEIGAAQALKILHLTGWSARADGPRTHVGPLAWADDILFEALLTMTNLQTADALRRAARSVLLSTPARGSLDSLVPPDHAARPTSGVQVRADVGRRVRRAKTSARPALRDRPTRRPQRERIEPATERSTVVPGHAGGVVVWTGDRYFADLLEERFERDDQVVFHVMDGAELRRALLVFGGRSPLVVLDRRGIERDEIEELRATDLEGCSVVVWAGARPPASLGAALARARRVVTCAPEADARGVVDLCSNLRRPADSVQP